MLAMFVLYKEPPWHPGKYVLLRHVVHGDGSISKDAVPLAVARIDHPLGLTAVRLPIPPGLVMVTDPDPTILEVWF